MLDSGGRTMVTRQLDGERVREISYLGARQARR